LRDVEGKWIWRDSDGKWTYSIYTRYSQLWVYFLDMPVHQEIPVVYTTPHYGGISAGFFALTAISACRGTRLTYVKGVLKIYDE